MSPKPDIVYLKIFGKFVLYGRQMGLTLDVEISNNDSKVIIAKSKVKNVSLLSSGVSSW